MSTGAPHGAAPAKPGVFTVRYIQFTVRLLPRLLERLREARRTERRGSAGSMESRGGVVGWLERPTPVLYTRWRGYLAGVYMLILWFWSPDPARAGGGGWRDCAKNIAYLAAIASLAALASLAAIPLLEREAASRLVRWAYLRIDTPWSEPADRSSAPSSHGGPVHRDASRADAACLQ